MPTFNLNLVRATTMKWLLSKNGQRLVMEGIGTEDISTARTHVRDIAQEEVRWAKWKRSQVVNLWLLWVQLRNMKAGRKQPNKCK